MQRVAKTWDTPAVLFTDLEGEVAERVTVTVRYAESDDRREFRRAVGRLLLRVATDEKGAPVPVDTRGVVRLSNRELKRRGLPRGTVAYSDPRSASFTVWGLRGPLEQLLRLPFVESAEWGSAAVPYRSAGAGEPKRVVRPDRLRVTHRVNAVDRYPGERII
jgi:hypothetical protein